MTTRGRPSQPALLNALRQKDRELDVLRRISETISGTLDQEAVLERIIEHGSITKAAKSMEMSYRHAWDLVDSMNRQAGKPFVELATGGKGGGGAIVTKDGKKAIKVFWTFHKDLLAFLKREEKKLKL